MKSEFTLKFGYGRNSKIKFDETNEANPFMLVLYK